MPCRKPKSGLVERAVRDFGLPSSRVFLIGDAATDAAAGRAAGCRTVLLGATPGPCDYRAAGFPEAAAWIAAQPLP